MKPRSIDPALLAFGVPAVPTVARDPGDNRRKARARRPATVWVFGPPRVGVTTLASLLAHPDVLPDVHLVDRIENEGVLGLSLRLEAARKAGARTVLVGGRPTSSSDLRELVRSGVLDSADAMLIRLWRQDPATAPTAKEFANEIGHIEEQIRALDLPYRMLWCREVDVSAAQLAAYARLEEK